MSLLKISIFDVLTTSTVPVNIVQTKKLPCYSNLSYDIAISAGVMIHLASRDDNYFYSWVSRSARAAEDPEREDPRVSRRRPSPRKMPEIRSARFTSERVNTVSESRPSRLYRRNALSSRRDATRPAHPERPSNARLALCHNTRSIIRETSNLPPTFLSP